MWYAANIIMYVKFKEGLQDKYPIWENIVLIEAKSEDEAYTKACKIGSQSEGDSQGTLLWDERPATWSLGGIRKIIKCDNSEERPSDGTEITYSQMEVYNEDDFIKLVKGEAVNIYYEEEF